MEDLEKARQSEADSFYREKEEQVAAVAMTRSALMPVLQLALEKQHEKEMSKLMQDFDNQKAKLAQELMIHRDLVDDQVASVQSDERMKMARALRTQMRQLALRQLQRMTARTFEAGETMYEPGSIGTTLVRSRLSASSCHIEQPLCCPGGLYWRQYTRGSGSRVLVVRYRCLWKAVRRSVTEPTPRL